MRIGIVTTWFERGAAYVSRQFMELLQETDEVFIYARGGENYARESSRWNLKNVHWGVRHEGKLSIFGTYIDEKDFKKWIERNGIEAVLFNEQRWFPPVLWCKAMGVKTIAYIDYYTCQTIPLFDCYDALICNTLRHASAFSTHRCVNYLKWGTDTGLYKPSNESHDKVVFFNSAGMDPIRKGTDLTIRAFHAMRNRKNAKLLVHSQVDIEKLCPEISGIIRELKSEGSLQIYEKTVPAPGLYEKGDVYVYPSRLDGVGLTLMEAISSGLACITVDNAPMNEFIDSSFGRTCIVNKYYCREDGYYWPMCEADVTSIKENMEYFLSSECNLCEMKRAARSYAVKELDFSKNIKPLSDIIRNCECRPVSSDLVSRISSYERIGIKKFACILALIYGLDKLVKKIKANKR